MNDFMTLVKAIPSVIAALISVSDLAKKLIDLKEYNNEINCRIKERRHKCSQNCNRGDNL